MRKRIRLRDRFRFSPPEQNTDPWLVLDLKEGKTYSMKNGKAESSTGERMKLSTAIALITVIAITPPAKEK